MRSQNKSALVNIDGYIVYRRETRVGELNYVWDIEAGNRDKTIMIGRYATEGRAIEVLSLIENHIYEIERMKLFPEDGFVNPVFEMPAE